jgi:PKD repeat protein
VSTYVSGAATALPVRVNVDNFWAGASGTVPGAGPAQPANLPPAASFTTAVSGAKVTVDASASTDSDGSVASYAWDFGDGATGSGRTTDHTYSAVGSHTVTLTVTDDDGATASTTAEVTVAAPPAGTALASDAFGRAVTGGFGTADVGGAWSVVGGAANTSVANGAARLSVPAPGTSLSAYLDGVSSLDTAVQFDATLDAATTGGGMFVYASARHSGSSDYRMGVGITPSGTVFLKISAMVNGAERELNSVTLPGLTYTPGTVLTVRFDVSGNGTTTLSGKAWPKGQPEPAAWQVTGTDTTAALQRTGGVGVDTYVSGSATAVPVRLTVDDFWAGAAGTARPTTPQG